jgi:DNA modification methylase
LKNPQVTTVDIASLTPDQGNVRKRGDRAKSTLAASLKQFGPARSIVLDSRDIVRAGNGTLEAFAANGGTEVLVVEPKPGQLVAVKRNDWSKTDAVAYSIGDNQSATLAEWDETGLAAQLEAIRSEDESMLDAIGFDDGEIDALIAKLGDEVIGSTGSSGGGSSAASTHKWEKTSAGASARTSCEASTLSREREMGSLNINTQELVNKKIETGDIEGGMCASQSGTSIFDPVLCEIAYRWFCPPGGSILDPFAGGSVRGIVAAKLGYRYTGIDLRPEQIAANEAQGAEICPGAPPRWIVGDSRNAASLAAGPYDLVFSCPPYADLERYSDDPADLSTLEYVDFIQAFNHIVAECVAMLRPNRFACFVVGDVRDPRGFYRNFVADTISAFQVAGAILYNEAILVTAVGSLPIRVGRQFSRYRKLGKTHQNVLVFYKGDIKRIPDEFGEVEVADPADGFGELME